MILKNARLADGLADIAIEEGKITAIGESLPGEILLDAQGKRVVPGLVDVHVHAFGGFDPDGQLAQLSLRLAREGTTCFLPTTMTLPVDTLRRITSQPLPPQGACIPGYHLEGPYLSYGKRGAQNPAYLRRPDLQELSTIPNVTKITVAPELPGAMDFIQGAPCQVSIGHTECDYLTARQAIAAGAQCLTHTFNGMPPLLHRQPGPIGAAMEAGIYAEVICDLMHVSPAAVLALYKMFGPQRLILISDTIRPGGCPDGLYESGGLEVVVKNGVCTLPDGTLAGGSHPLWYGVKKAVEIGIPFEDALRMATQTPAESLGLPKGRIAVGYDADLLVLEEDFSLSQVYVAGRLVK